MSLIRDDQAELFEELWYLRDHLEKFNYERCHLYVSYIILSGTRYQGTYTIFFTGYCDFLNILSLNKLITPEKKYKIYSKISELNNYNPFLYFTPDQRRKFFPKFVTMLLDEE